MSRLHTDSLLTIDRRGRFLVASLRVPHRVLSTALVGGGLRDDCRYVVNHQSCEGNGDAAALQRWRELGHEGSHRLACEQVGVDPERTVLMSTAANMQCAALAQTTYGELAVTVVATAGVLGNATRAGDRAAWHETPGGCDKVECHPGRGTIVHLAFFNRPCTPGCLVKAVSMLTEAKTTALLDLRIPSLQSHRLATGTGTDQFALCAPLPGQGDWERRLIGSHDTLGEILCEAVRVATTRSLLLQNGLVPTLRRSVLAALERFGLTLGVIETVAQRELGPEQAEFAMNNGMALIHDPQPAASAYAVAEIVDVLEVGILNAEMRDETLASQCAVMGAAVALRPELYATFRQRLLELPERDLPQLAAHALVWGFAEKWKQN
ncbi:MAG: adenosylcobinamide amidohydrolase [Gammaproteobacteria bacterium]